MVEQPPPDETGDFIPSDKLVLDASLSGSPDSVRLTSDAGLSEGPRVHPCQPVTEAETPLDRLDAPEMAEAAAPSGGTVRFLLDGEIARGGMGAILKARDLNLGRDIAVKVLLESHAGKTEFARRFVEEARIAGQLQHPGIAPVYELGVLPDHRPYFTMKLVKGQTLTVLLAARPEPAAELPKFLGIFAQVCQTLAYAHARRVIHRDLKPSNVMVGAFGEVQVMDWGLSKVLSEGDEPSSECEEVSVIRTQRGTDSPEMDSHTQAGTLLGTPAYIPPEQARGDVDLVDERADVFGLGAILCEILTGQPPFAGKGAEATRKAQAARLDDAYARLDGCGADGELIALAKRCLAADLTDRPRHAGQVADEVTAYQLAVAERLRQAELERAAADARAVEEGRTRQMAEAKAAEERKRRRLTAALAAAVLLLLMLGVGGWLWLRTQREARLAQTNRAVNEALNQATTLRQRASTAQGRAALDLAAQARAQTQRAQSLVESGETDAALAAQVRQLLAELDADEKDRQLLAALETARLAPVEVNIQRHTYTRERAVPLYREAFRVYAMAAGEGEAAAAAARLGKRPAAVREAVLAALDEWIALVEHNPRLKEEEAHLDWLRQVRASVTPEGWRKRIQDAAAEKDPNRRRAALVKLAESADVELLPAQALTTLARRLHDVRAEASALALLRRGQVRYADDFWINEDLGQALRTQRRPAEAVCYLTAAAALHPDSYVARLYLGEALLEQRRLAAAVAECRKAIELEPKYPRAHYYLGLALLEQGKVGEAVAEIRETLAMNPGFANNLFASLAKQSKLDEVIAEFRKIAELHPKDAAAHRGLSTALQAKGGLDEAGAAEILRAWTRNPSGKPAVRAALIQSFARQGRLEEIRSTWQKILEGNPPKYDAWYGYAELCLFLGHEDEYRRACTALLARFGKATDPQVAERTGRACLLLPASPDELHQASALVDRALAAGPKHQLYAYFELAKGLADYRQGQFEPALAPLRKCALRIPQLTPRLVLAMAEFRCGRQEEARRTLAQAIAAYQWNEADASYGDPWIYHVLRREAEELIVPNLSAFLKGQYQPRENKERLELIEPCRFRKRYLLAAQLYADAFASDAKRAGDLKANYRYNGARAAVLAAANKLDDKERIRWRKQGFDWLRADLTAYGKLLDSGKPEDRVLVRQRLQHWQRDNDLAGIRDKDAVAELPPQERQACAKLWADVAMLLHRTEKKK